MRITIILFLLIFFSSCKGTNDSEQNNLIINKFAENTIVDTKTLRKTNSISKTKINTDSISNLFKLPVGQEKLIQTKFPINWVINSELKNSNINQKINNNFDSITINLQKLFRSNISSSKNQYIRQESIINSHLNKYLNLDKINLHKFTKNNIPIGLLPNKFNYKVCLFSGNINTDYNKWADLVIIDKSNQVISGLNIYNYFERPYMAQQKLFFIDENYIIHIKDFLMYEDSGNLLQSKMYQISNEGKFVRFYNKNGKYKNDTEEGLVKNNTRNGKWIEKISNGLVNQYTYVESEYLDANLIGKRYFYEFDYDKNEYGEIILKTGKKGKLLYTETYENGKMIKREFVK